MVHPLVSSLYLCNSVCDHTPMNTVQTIRKEKNVTLQILLIFILTYDGSRFRLKLNSIFNSDDGSLVSTEIHRF